MNPNTRAMVAASSFAALTGSRVAGIYDHSASRDRRIAAECRGDELQGFDGDRGARFGGKLPELYDALDEAYVSLEIADGKASGYDRQSSSHYHAEVKDGVVQVYDHAEGCWFAYDIQDPAKAQDYRR